LTERALVIGGTGPTGPLVVQGLAERGYAVTILHGGQHEVTLAEPDVRHIHADPHFAETLADGVGHDTYDLVVAQYGRLNIIADFFAGRTNRLIAVGSATGIYAGGSDPRWGGFGRPAIFAPERGVLADAPDAPTLNRKMVAAWRALEQHDTVGHYAASYLGYPVNYGPRQPGPQDWSVVRRLLDGRPRMIIADGGLKLESRISTRNAAAGLLCVLDNLEQARGRRFVVADHETFTMRARIDAIAAVLGRELELIDLPYDLAWPSHPLWRFERGHRLCRDDTIRSDLGYQDAITADDGLRDSVEWLIANPPPPGGEAERQLGDPFDYASEDRLIEDWHENRRRLPESTSPLTGRAHAYRHPKQAGEQWHGRPPERGA
jgi:nucleoside-diphosphate-sugar epimerase